MKKLFQVWTASCGAWTSGMGGEISGVEVEFATRGAADSALSAGRCGISGSARSAMQEPLAGVCFCAVFLAVQLRHRGFWVARADRRIFWHRKFDGGEILGGKRDIERA